MYCHVHCLLTVIHYLCLCCHVASAPTIGQLILLKWKNKQGQEQRLRILHEVCTKWKDIGGVIGLNPSPLDAIEKHRLGDMMECCRDVFRVWLQQEEGSYPVTWDGVRELLKDMELFCTAQKLDEFLLNKKL